MRDDTKSNVAPTFVWRKMVPNRRSRIHGAVCPRAAPVDFFGSVFWGSSVPFHVPILVVPVVDPFGYVAVHIVQPESVRVKGTHRTTECEPIVPNCPLLD